MGNTFTTWGTNAGGGGAALGGEGPGLLPTLLAPVRYAKLMGISIPHFMQLGGTKAPLTTTCDDLWDQPARDALVWTIAQAEQLIADVLGFWPAPKYITDEEIPFNLRRVRSDWWNAEVNTKYAYTSCFGKEKLTLVEAGATMVYSDMDSDPLGREEYAQIEGGLYGGLPACAKACDVAVFFRVADGAPSAAHPYYEIRPLSVKITGSTMYITGESAQFVKPILWNLTKNACLGSDDINGWRWDFALSNLVSAVDVYCRTCDEQTPVTLRWDGRCACGTSPCAHDTQCGCAYVTNKINGSFIPRPATWSGSANIYATALYSDPPESLFVNYLAGYPLNSQCLINENLERAIVKLTNAMLPEPPCGYCDLARRNWELDRSPIDPLTTEAASMPWGFYYRGALDAWRIVKMLLLGKGAKMGR